MKKLDLKNKKHLVLFLFAVIVLGVIAYFSLGKDGLLEMVESTLPSPASTPSVSTSTPTPASSSETAPEEDKILSVYVIDVGQGDSSLLISPNGKTMLIDSGEYFAYEAVSELLDSLNITVLDVVVATHPHSDHIGCMDDIIFDYEVGTFYLTYAETSTKSYDNMLYALEKSKNTKVLTADASSNDIYIEWDNDVEVRILSPFNDEYYEDLNDSSIILNVTYRNNSMLFTGDAGKYAENIALNRLPKSVFDADVLKVGHHGSSKSGSYAFLNAVSPDYAVISCGKDNDYGHPHRETKNELKKRNVDVYRTDTQGTVHVIMDGTNIKITTQK